MNDGSNGGLGDGGLDVLIILVPSGRSGDEGLVGGGGLLGDVDLGNFDNWGSLGDGRLVGDAVLGDLDFLGSLGSLGCFGSFGPEGFLDNVGILPAHEVE